MKYASILVVLTILGLVQAVPAGIITTVPDQLAVQNDDTTDNLQPLVVADMRDLYLGFTLEWTAGVIDNNDFAVLNFNGEDGINVGFKANEGGSGTNDILVRFNSGGGTAYSATEAFIGMSVRIVLRISETGGSPSAYDQAAFWIDPDVADEATPEFTVNDSDDEGGPADRVGMRIVNLSSNDVINFRDIVVSDDFRTAVIIPEPASLALLSFGGFALLRRR